MNDRAKEAEGNVVNFFCPGCEEVHGISHGAENRWVWNGSLKSPTFQPSVLVRGNQWPKDEYPEYFKPRHPGVFPGEDTVCHSFVTCGRIQFLPDSTHELSGQTVDLPDWPYTED